MTPKLFLINAVTPNLDSFPSKFILFEVFYSKFDPRKTQIKNCILLKLLLNQKYTICQIFVDLLKKLWQQYGFFKKWYLTFLNITVLLQYRIFSVKQRILGCWTICRHNNSKKAIYWKTIPQQIICQQIICRQTIWWQFFWKSKLKIIKT